MKDFYKHLVLKLAFAITILSAGNSYGQCSFSYYSGGYSGPGTAATSSGTNFVTLSNYSPGTYFNMTVLAGGSYAISTCGNSIPTTITGMDNNYNYVFTDSGNGSLCSGSSNGSIGSYVPNFTGYLYVNVTDYGCGAYGYGSGISSIYVFIRQNDNLSFTSSSAAMCSGQTRTLTATPANVGSAPAGDPGNFYGTGVSGNVFTAPTVTAPTNYTITYTFGYVSHTQVLTVNPNPTVTASASNSVICNTATTSVIGGGASTYTWTASSGTATDNTAFSPGTTATYSVVGTSSSGCVSLNTAVVSVSVNPRPVISVTSGSICNGQSFTMAPSGASTYTYSSGSAVVSPASNASYSVTGTSSLGCVSSNTAVSTVTVSPLPAISVNSGAICNGQSFTMAPSGASTYTYSSGSAVVSPTITASYSVTGTSTAGCVSSVAGISSVTVNALPVISVNSGSICNGQSFTMAPSGANTYTYSSGSAVVSPATAASYSVTGTSAAGCVSSNAAVSSVVVNTVPVVSVTGGTICNGQSFTLTPSGASTYTYSGGSAIVSPTSTASYSVTGTSAAGCLSSNTAVGTVTVNARPSISVNSGAICNGQSFTMTPSGANTYTYSSGAAVVSPTATASYSVTGTSTAGCVSSVAGVSSVTVNTLPVISVNSGAICNGQSFTMAPSGASTYTYSGGSAVVSPTAAASYSVTGTSTAGCVSTAAAVSSVTVNAVPVLTVSGAGTICNGNSVTYTVAGASTYSWNGASIPSTIQVSPAGTTVYTVSGTNSSNCSAALLQTVTVNASPTITVNSATICSGNSVVITPTGAATYTINGGSFTVSPSSTTAYSVTGSSSGGCLSANTAVASVSVNALPVLTVSGTSTICAGGSSSFAVSGASTYSWNAAALPSGTISVVPATTTVYTVSGTAANGCSSTLSKTVTVNALPVLTVTGGSSVCNGSSVTLTVSGANTYSWSTSANTNTITISPTLTTTYSVTGTNTNNCVSATLINTVTVNATPTVAISGGTICAGQSLNLAGSGAATYTYSGGNAVVSPTATTVYSVSGTSSLGCVSANTATASVVVNALPVIAISGPTAICSGGIASFTASGALTFTWNTAANSSTMSPTASTVYMVSGTNTNNCVGTASVALVVNARPVVTIAGTNTSCAGSPVILTASGASTYAWNTLATSASVSVSPNLSTTYSVTGTNTNNCSNTATFAITVNPLPTVAITGQTSICEGKPTFLTAVGAATYSWSTGSTAPVISVLPANTSTYSVTGVDIYGCENAASQTVTVNPSPVLTVAYSNSVICVGETATISVSGAASYTWNSQNSSTIVVSPVATIQYSIAAVDANGCTGTAVATQSVSDCTGIKTIASAAEGISVYPNPNAGAFTIELNADAQVIICNSIGQQVFSQALNAGKQAIDLQSEGHGIYFVKVIGKNGQTIVKMIKE